MVGKRRKIHFQGEGNGIKGFWSLSFQSSDKPLVWCGDLNVRYLFSSSIYYLILFSFVCICGGRDSIYYLPTAYICYFSHEEIDVSHPEVFSAA
jgi:hypothetical protein